MKHLFSLALIYPSRQRKQLWFLFTVIFFLFNLTRIKNPSNPNDDDDVTSAISVIILTYKKHEALFRLIPSVLHQKPSELIFEVIIADNGCLIETEKVFNDAYNWRQLSMPIKRLPFLHHLKLCDNLGYAAGNNAAAKLVSPTSKYILFLNDDVVLTRPNFLQNMVKLLAEHQNAVGAGCKLVDASGKELIEAGSMVFQDGSAAGYGRGDRNPYADKYSYPRPVDYVSGACLMVEKEIFTGYIHADGGFGFDRASFPNYYEDTDFQLYIQHILNKEVWLQPKSVARHDEHGSFGKDESLELMKHGRIKFLDKWQHKLEKHINHLDHSMKASLLLGADLRARDYRVANILYIDTRAPNKSMGAGFGRAFDNLSMLAEQGHRLTLFTEDHPGLNKWCTETCLEEIIELGIEYAVDHTFDHLLKSRVGFYDVLIVSRPDTLRRNYHQLINLYVACPFVLVYDCEALTFRRNKMLSDLVNIDSIPFGGMRAAGFQDPDKGREMELALLSMSDIAIPVSENEASVILQLTGGGIKTITIGHVMTDRIPTKTFEEREGILFLGSFSSGMYYNGDALWYFLEYIYPLVFKRAPIRLTVAGRNIPAKILSMVENDEEMAKLITFEESPITTSYLFESHRMLIAPHLYGAGIQYKVSESLSVGLPVVMSSFTHDSFGKIPGCVGKDVPAMVDCILQVYGHEKKWTLLQQEGLKFIRETHNRKQVMAKWSSIISLGLDLATSRKRVFSEGENLYRKTYADTVLTRTSAFSHYLIYGRKDNRIYQGADQLLAGPFSVNCFASKCFDLTHMSRSKLWWE